MWKSLIVVLMLTGCASDPEASERGMNAFMAGLSGMNGIVQAQQAQRPAFIPQPQYQQPAGTTPSYALTSQSVSNNMRYCRYMNGAVLTVGMGSFCPVTTP